jgi:hypothetical protein
MVIRLSLLLGLFALPAQANSPIAEVICAERAAMEQRLTQQHGAQLNAMGLRDSETTLEVWSDPMGRWTLVQTYPNGQACILAMGTDWGSFTPPDPA